MRQSSHFGHLSPALAGATNRLANIERLAAAATRAGNEVNPSSLTPNGGRPS
jgi:hypothetical protein